MSKLWTKEKTEYLERNYLIEPNIEIAKKINKTPNSVNKKIVRMGLNKKYQIEYAVYQGEEHLFTGNREECMERLGVNGKAFSCLLHRTGKYDNGIHIVNLGRWEVEE